MKFKMRKSDVHSGTEIKTISMLWNKNESKILRDIKDLTGISANTNSLICYLDDTTSNGYYGSRTIFLGTKGISRDDILMVISHELFHIFYWRMIKKLKLTRSSPGTESKEEWKLAEVAAYLLTSEPALKKYWPNAKVYLYPETRDVYRRVRKFWKKGSFEEFLVNSYKIIIQ